MWRIRFFAAIFAAIILLNESTGALDIFPPGVISKIHNYERNDEGSKTKTSFKSITESSKAITYKGGCLSNPDIPINGKLTCSSTDGCRATCTEGYRFPNGEGVLTITCRERLWRFPGSDYSNVPHCEPICEVECKNNGICIAPNQCNCVENFSGPQCQFENKPCLNPPPIIANAQRKCNLKTCTVSCLNNFVFPDGSAVTNLVCKHGNWEPTKSGWSTIPDCQPVCKPSCQNGGVCLSLNVCQCPKDFRGPQCQYPADVCNAKKLVFNGGYQCNSVDEQTYACTLTCPDGTSFEYPPAASYQCRYSEGIFQPEPVPQCKPIQIGTRLISVGGLEKTSIIQTVNQSWSMKTSTSFSQTSQIQHQIGISGTFGVGGIGIGGGINIESTAGSNTVEQSDGNDVGVVEKVEKKPEAGSCFTWGGVHYKTFDGQIYSFESHCAYTLLKDTKDGLFTVTVQNDPTTCSSSSIGSISGRNCSRLIHLYVQGKDYVLGRGSTGLPELRTGKGKVLPIPSQLTHVRVVAINGGRFLVASLDAVGLTIRWDGAKMLQLEATESLWNRMSGLCGSLNGERSDDFGIGVNTATHLANNWRIEDIGENCEEYPSRQHPCSSSPDREKEAGEFCAKLLSDQRYKKCARLIDPVEFETTCRWDYCTCSDTDRRKCACDTMGVYVRQCAHKGIVTLSGWRDSNICPMECTNGKIYMSCGPKSQPSCGADQLSQAQESKENEVDGCEEGCYCPAGSVLHEDRCIAPETCPCQLRGKSYEAGATVLKDCNTCACLKGKWTCTEAKCSGRCSAVGDPHYTTFDGKRYDFMGKCSYYLLKAEDYSVEAENAVCTSAISEMMGFTRTFQDNEPSCTKTVTIRLNDVAIKLKQNRQILVNGEDVTRLPTLAGGAKIRIVSSIFISVQLSNGLEVLWDGVSRVYVNAPAEFRGKTKGLCGTFSSNQKDDFLTPDGDVEQTVAAFANKWKTNEQCADVKKDTDHPCDINPQNRAAAEKYCSVLQKQLFKSCHDHVNYEPFYKDCIYDMCACETNVETCLCPTLSAYAKDCSQLGVVVPWRQEVKECRIHCPGDQEYQMCGSSCSRSCADISFHTECKEECVEGCNCPKGYTLNVNGECIPIGQCPCSFAGLEFSAGYREVRPGTKGQELCTCAAGLWNCHLANTDEVRDYPAVADLKSRCSAIKHLEVTTCEPAEPRTCRNMHQRPNQSPAICRPGCVCRPGYVLDSPSGECVREQECPCYHGGQSYKEDSVMQEECNTCKCNAGKWSCTDIICPGICSVWGDSHYKTFDDHQFDFQGVCDYVLAKGKLSDVESFDVVIRNVPCGTTGVTCSKAVTLTVGKTNSADQESVTLTRGKSLSADTFRGLTRIVARRAGLFIFLDVPDLGLVLQWDEGTRVYLRLASKWKGRTKGLCGDFNDDAEDDFKTPSGGVSEASASLFADSWKMSELCPEPSAKVMIDDIRPDTCALHPERKLWATQRCRIIKSEVFASCHSEVEPEPYIERCISDACGCDDGGDCECLCTAIAAYAHECNTRGVPVKWRTQQLCPLQCDETCSNYSPCVSTCPRETCENLVTRSDFLHLCDQDTCVEGCQPNRSCPPDQVYYNSSHNDCVPRSECRILCRVIDGIEYHEGERVSGDECHSCFCSRGNVVCKGAPCTVARTTPTTIAPSTSGDLQAQPVKCKEGWTDWLNRDLPKALGFRSEKENIPTIIELSSTLGSPVCQPDQMVDIECRTTDTHTSYKEIGLDLDIECSLDRGMYCKPSRKLGLTCPDFEIRVKCRCEDKLSSTTPTPDIEECILSEPYRSVANNCAEFLQCEVGIHGNKWTLKTCGDDMMFNEKLQVCDWPANVVVTRPECAERIIHPPPQPIDKCKEGEYWNECAIQCSRTCDYYKYQLTQDGLCNKTVDCVAGCVSASRSDCPPDEYWRDSVTCVDRSHCTCSSETGELLAPGAQITVTECKMCQCVNNYYSCDESSCVDVTKNGTWTEKIETIIDYVQNVTIVPNTATPPRDCPSEEQYVWLVEREPSVTNFTASSYFQSIVQPEWAQLHHTYSMLTWRPEIDNNEQWLEVHLSQPRPVYGVVIGGDVFTVAYVTSYYLLFSEDGHSYSYVTKPGQPKVPKVFSGQVDSSEPVMQILHSPIEAKIVRFVPITWHKNIAMQVELVGCDNERTTTTTTTTVPPSTTVITERPIEPVCNDQMGYDSGIMSDQQVSVSSSFFSGNAANLRLSSPEAWRPQLDNPDQYVQFDFLEPRDITGVETKGGNGMWTSAYKVHYSNDGKRWNPVTNKNGAEREFLGNVDDYSGKINYFEKPVAARMIRIYPTRWHLHIGLRVEIRGCFLPYPIVEPTTIKTTPAPQIECNICNGVTVNESHSCNCDKSFWWDGQFCVNRPECPCMVDHVRYTIGASYETANCEVCTCTLGGNSVCHSKKCPACTDAHHGYQSVLTELCGCLCKPCPDGMRLCPSSNECIDKAKWCNGVNDCPDDERDCTGIIVRDINTTIITTEIKRVNCEISCGPGFIVEYIKEPVGMGNSFAKSSFTMNKTVSMKTSISIKTKIPAPPITMHSRSGGPELCPKFICKGAIVDQPNPTEPCKNIECSEGFQPRFDQSKSYRKTHVCNNICVPIPPKERVCSLDGRTFTTFDYLVYNYDICNHILVRDREENKWFIVVETVCDDHNLSCKKALKAEFDNHMVILHPDMYVVIDGNLYSPNEVKHLANKHPAMTISRVGNALRLESRQYPFWALLESSGLIKVGVSETLSGFVHGMCGYLDGLIANDQEMPDGKMASSSQEFGDSWKLIDSAECQLQVCPPEARAEAWKICNSIKDANFAVCDNALKREKFVTSCMESTCACLGNGNSTNQECRCVALASFVAECLAADKTVDLSTWRTIYDCPAFCDAPFVHKDCFRNKCEMSCENLQEIDPCPVMDKLCVPGCFCPDGTVRSGDTCVPPSECRDCVCNGFGGSKYVNFDRSSLSFNGNCTYLLSRDVINAIKGQDEKHTYEILVSNGACDLGICTEVITVIYQTHFVQIRRDNLQNELLSIIDGDTIDKYPYKNSWLNLEKSPNRDVNLLIPAIQLEIVSLRHDFSFMLRLPSHTFGGAMEGLCGNCNSDQRDDFKTFDGEITEDVQEFGNSWLVRDLPAALGLGDEHCGSTPEKLCHDDPEVNELCAPLLREDAFVRCHGLVDPTPYYLACRDSLCNGFDACVNFEAYARSCSLAGICVNWRSPYFCPYTCPNYLEYHACHSGCPETCENIDILQSKCMASPIEGCFCQDGFIWRDGNCVPWSSCFVCDDEGHVEGDVWSPDKCSVCTCQNRMLNCTYEQCPALETVCDMSSTPVLVPGTENDCCPKYLCVPVTTAPPPCVEVQQPNCGFAQNLKITYDSNGCQKFICQCVPEDECSGLFENEVAFGTEILEPGFVKVTDTSGCCPRTSNICKPETCPPPPICQEYYNPIDKSTPNSCCPRIECEPSKDWCLYYADSNNDLVFVDNLVAKKINEKWEDGKCKSCICELQAGIPTPKCTKKECLNTFNHPDINDFILEEVILDDQCCPNFERVACKYDDNVYQVGEKWYPHPYDACVSTECSLDTNGIVKKTIVQKCLETCDLGYEYRAPYDKRTTCCGECIPVACAVNGELKNVGETWYTENFCVLNTCILANGSLHVQVARDTCEIIDPLEESNYIIENQPVYGKCCPNVVRTACIGEGVFYNPGDTWQSSLDSCIIESCIKTADGKITKQKETKTCNTDCPKGWEYQQPEPGKCCGECKQIYCIIDDFLYEPGKTWYSDDNCTSYSCTQNSDQLLISTSSVVCPDVDCSPEFMYDDGCCKKCKRPDHKKLDQCVAEVRDFEETIGMLSEKKGIHGFCKNLEPIEGLTECHGHCDSSSHFNLKTWDQEIDCKCCQPGNYRKIVVQLTCEDGKKFKRHLSIPSACSCKTCSSH